MAMKGYSPFLKAPALMKLNYQIVISRTPVGGVYTRPAEMQSERLDCSLKVSELGLQLHFYVHFPTNTIKNDIEPSYPRPQLWVR